VVSIFLISRSKCAFVNYDTEAHLQAAIARFHGVPLRADPRCALLVCRVRPPEEHLRTGVGWQRGVGMHRRWVEEKAARDGSASAVSASHAETPSSGAHSLESSLSALAINDHCEVPGRPPLRQLETGSNSSTSQSTNSSFLRQHFPQRFFVLKSLTQVCFSVLRPPSPCPGTDPPALQDKLDLSVQTGAWATQKHNEAILDHAFRTSEDVFLVFSANKSGAFYGYARCVPFLSLPARSRY
jgi:hypothetical protein